MSIRIVELEGITPAPWRNGGGTTRDLLAWPDPVQWQLRISIAAIERDGPFSDFSGIERWLVVLHGAGMALRMAGELYEVRRGAPPLQFNGALAPMCTLLDGPTSDINLMVRHDAGKARMHDVRPGTDWVTNSAWRALVAADPVHLVVDGHVTAGTRGTALLWSASASGQHWRMRPQQPAHARGWWIEFRPRHEDKP